MGRWRYVVVHGQHNHPLPKYPEGQPLGKLSADESERVRDESSAGLRTNPLLTLLKKIDDNNSSTQMHVHNAVLKFVAEERNGRSPLDIFLNKLHEKKYYKAIRKKVASDVVGDIFFSHPMAEKFLRCYPYVILADVTYSTNCYGLSLLQIVGFTPVNKSFTVAVVFLEHERTENFVWALEHVKHLFTPPHEPNVIMTDADKALIKAVPIVFPNSAHHLCRRHIEKCVEDRAKTLTRRKEFGEKFMHKFNWAISAPTAEEWSDRWQHLKAEYVKYPSLIAYLEHTWIEPYAEMVLSMHTDNHLHFGTHTTNRVESEHSRLKHALGSSFCTFDYMFKHADDIMEIQINAIKSSLAKSMTRTPVNLLTSHLFRGLLKKVSRHALKIMQEQRGNNKDAKCVVTKDDCGCYFRRTHGLPCRCELQRVKQRNEQLVLSQIHPFWRTLDLEAPVHVLQPEPEPTTTDLNRLFELSSPATRRRILKDLQCEQNPDLFNVFEPPQVRKTNRARASCSRIPSSWENSNIDAEMSRSASMRQSGSRNSFIARTAGEQMSVNQSNDDPMSPANQRSRASTGSDPMGTPTSRAPTDKVRGRGRGRGAAAARRLDFSQSDFADKLLSVIVPYVQSCTDVVADGNCGFRCVALQVFGDEKQWPQVRIDCCMSLIDKRAIYEALNPWVNIDVLYKKIHHFQGPCDFEHWLSFPDMGFVIATVYNVVVVSYSSSDGVTCFPAADLEGRGPATQTIVLGHVNNNHFISLQMRTHDEYPVPNVPNYWEARRHVTAPDLMPTYNHRIHAYNTLRANWLRHNHGPYRDQGPIHLD